MFDVPLPSPEVAESYPCRNNLIVWQKIRVLAVSITLKIMKILFHITSFSYEGKKLTDIWQNLANMVCSLAPKKPWKYSETCTRNHSKYPQNFWTVNSWYTYKFFRTYDSVKFRWIMVWMRSIKKRLLKFCKIHWKTPTTDSLF